MYLFYVDESGTRDCNLVKMRKDGTALNLDHVYVLTAVSLFDGRWRSFERAINAKKREWIDNLVRRGHPRLELSDCEVKSNWIRNPKERARHPLLSLLSDEAVLAISNLYFDQLSDNNITIFSIVVDKRHLHEYMDESKLHKKAWELLLERVEDFLATEHERHKGILIFDDVSKEMNRTLAMKHAYLLESGTTSGRRLKHIIEMPLFVRSELCNGIQLADLVSYNIYRVFKTQAFDYPWFRRILPHFWKPTSQTMITPKGLKIFPPESPLLARMTCDPRSPWSGTKEDRGADCSAPR